jgi:hypothetical protein
MPEQVRQTERPELGYTSLGEYLDANRQSLDQAFGQAQSDAAQFKGPLTDPMASHELGRQLMTESGLAGSGRFGTGPYGEWNAGLNWAAHGPGYQGLGEYLGKIQPPPPPGEKRPMPSGPPAPTVIEPPDSTQPDPALKPRRIPKRQED